MVVYSQKYLKEYRRKLRNEMPEPERILWRQLRCDQLKNCKFRRQHSIGDYIVDFYSRDAKLVIEVDGDSHYDPEALAYDKVRSEFLNRLGLEVIRFTNRDICDNIAGVVETIYSHIR